MDDEAGSPDESGLPTMQMMWRNTTTLFIDGVIGIAHAGGVARVVLGQVNFNPLPEAQQPLLTPVCGLLMTVQGIDSMIGALTEARKQLVGDDE